MNRHRQILLSTAIITACFVAVVGLSVYLEGSKPQLPADFADSDLNLNGSSLKGFVFGTEGLIADWYYMRSLQYIGAKLLSRQGPVDINNLSNLNPRLLYPLLENATELDPHFIAAFSYSAVVLPAIDPEKAIFIATKGVANNPGDWRLYQQLGYIYWKLGRYDEAAEMYEKGSEVAGAAPFMKMMAGVIKNDGGSRATSRKIFQQMYDGSGDAMVRLTAIRRLHDYDSLDEREAIDKTLAEYKQTAGHCANSLIEILPLLRSVHLPEGRDFRVDDKNSLVDPTDAPYLLDKENCRVKLDPERTGLTIQ